MESFGLETISELHPLATHLFVPFVVARLQERSEDLEAVLTVELRNIRGATTAEHPLRLFWQPESIPRQPLAIQDNSLTEWAALGVACVVVWHFAGLGLHAVAGRGDRFDYWVLHETKEFGLEVSGTTLADIEPRHREKTDQMRDNPYATDGYVVVVGFQTRRVILSFHRFEEIVHESTHSERN